jgi:hypothetical protein
VCGKVIPTRD